MSKKINILNTDKERPNLHSLFHEYINRCGKELYKRHRNDAYDFDLMDSYDFETLASLGLLSGIYPSDEDYDFDDYELVFPYNSKSKRSVMSDDDAYAAYWAKEEMKRNARRAANQARRVEDADYVEIGGKKKKHRRGGKKNRLVDINQPYSGWEDNPDEVGDVVVRDGYSLDTPIVTIWFYPNYCNQDDKLEFDSLKAFDDFCCDEGYVVPPYIAEDLAYRSVSHACLRPEARERGIFEIFAAESYNEMAYEVCNVEELSQ